MSPAPKGNLFALNCQTSGRPPMYKTPEEFCKKLDEYIAYEDEAKGGVDANGMGKGIYTIEGASLFLGFQSRTSFYDYAKKEEFMYIVERFILFMTQWNVRKLYWGGTFAGAMFWLKNWGGYKDESSQNVNQTVTEVTITEKKREEK